MGVDERGEVLVFGLFLVEIALGEGRRGDHLLVQERERELQDLSLHEQEDIEHLLYDLIGRYSRFSVFQVISQDIQQVGL